METHTDKSKILSSLNFKYYYESELPSIKWNGKEGLALCPFHDDKKPSLSVNPDTGLIKCFGCGFSGDIFTFHGKKYDLSFKDALADLAKIAGLKEPKEKKIIETYDYQDQNGNLLFQAVRYEPKDFRQRRPDNKGNWVWSLKDITTVIYNLPEVIKAQTVYIVEGEKDVETLGKISIVGTTNPQGAGKWREHFNPYLAGRDVVIIPDNDEPGRLHAESIAKSLSGIAKSIKIVDLPGLPEKADVTDWINAGHTKGELLALVEKTDQYKIQTLWDTLPSGADLQKADIKIDWVIDDVYPKQSTGTLTGKGGIGKSTIALCMMDAITKGEPFLGHATQKMDALYVDFENPLAVVIERVRVSNVTNVKFWHNGMDPKPPRIDSPEYVEYMKFAPCFIAFDSLRASQSGDENSSKDMGLVMQRYNELRDYGHTILIIQHTQKANERMFRGSMAISDLVDHPIFFYPVRNTKSDEAVEDANFDELPFYFGTTEKTRFHHFKTYIKRAGNGKFVIAEHPKFEKMQMIAELCQDKGEMKKQDVIKLVNTEFANKRGFGKVSIGNLLSDKDGLKYWTIRLGDKNAQFYSFYPLYRGDKTIKQNSASFIDLQEDSEEIDLQDTNNTELYSYLEGNCKTVKHNDYNDDDFIPEISEDL